MRLDIRYRMHFRYSEPVSESQSEVRVQPRDDDFQQLLSYRLGARPQVPVLSVVDYWGTTVAHVGLRTPHDEFELLAEAAVETGLRPVPDVAVDVGGLTDESFMSAHFEELAPSPHVAWAAGDAVALRASAATCGVATLGDAVTAVIDEVRAILAYRPGVTEIGVSLGELLEGRAGVCQDFAHLAIGMLRSIGVPARYVSGYLFAADETSAHAESSDVVSVQTHAWIEVAVPGGGWWALDPTNGGTVGERHVVIGRGRDYGDVPPVRGAFIGSGRVEVDAEVVIGKRMPVDEVPRPPRRGGARGSVAESEAMHQRRQQYQQ